MFAHQTKEQEVAAAEARTARLEEQVTTLEAASLETAQKHADEIAELVRPCQITCWSSALDLLGLQLITNFCQPLSRLQNTRLLHVVMY